MLETISKAEMILERTPKELLDWVEAKIEAIDEESIRLRRGLAKQLTEELYPLAIFAFKKYGDNQMVRVKLIIGSHNYDAILTDNSSSPVLKQYIEVTQSHEGEIVHFRTLYLQEHGYAPITSTKKKQGTKKTGIKVTAQFEAVDAVESAEGEMQRVLDAIFKKEGKVYPPNAILVVMFDDGYMTRRIINNSTIDKIIQEKILSHDLHFDEIYLVGKFKYAFRQYRIIRDSNQIIQVVTE